MQATTDIAQPPGAAAPKDAAWERALESCRALRDGDGGSLESRRALLGFLAPGGPLPGSARALAEMDETEWADAGAYGAGPATRLGPTLYAGLRDAGLDGRLPAATRSTAAEAYEANRALNGQRRRDLGVLLERLSRGGLSAVVLKGPYMVEHVYRDGAVRTMSDIDLLVPRDALGAVEAVLLEMGFGPDAEWRPSLEWSLAGSLWIWPLDRVDATVVSVHWTIEDPRSPFTIDPDLLWARSQSVRMADQPARILSPEDYLLHLCLHAAYRHGFETPARCYYDLALMTAHFAGVDWNALVERAQQWGCPRLVYAAYEITRDLFGVGAPEEVTARLGGTPSDRDAVRIAVEHTLRAPAQGSREWRTARTALDAWMRDVVGTWPLVDW
jgi:hypothetical protein